MAKVSHTVLALLAVSRSLWGFSGSVCNCGQQDTRQRKGRPHVFKIEQTAPHDHRLELRSKFRSMDLPSASSQRGMGRSCMKEHTEEWKNLCRSEERRAGKDSRFV